MVNLAKNYGCELFLSVGPRATYDTSATVHTKEGSRIGYRLRGYDNLVFAIEDVKRAVSLGVRGILLYDEGLLYVLNQMRNDGELPKNLHFKMSAHAGHGNPASAKLLESIGLNSTSSSEIAGIVAFKFLIALILFKKAFVSKFFWNTPSL